MRFSVCLIVVLFVSYVLATKATEYINPLVDHYNSADPGVLKLGDTYYAVTTSEDAPDCYPIRVSKDMVKWEIADFVFPRDRRPVWAMKSFCMFAAKI
jgi:beta-xylosidase